MSPAALLTPAIERALCDLVAIGLPLDAAARELGLGEQSPYRWVRLGRAGREPYVQLVRSLEVAHAERARKVKRAITEARRRAASGVGVCIDCGKPTSGKSQKRCLHCSSVLQGGINRDRWLVGRALVEQMWADGMTAREIAEALGRKSFNASVYRDRGYDLPRRRRYSAPDASMLAAMRARMAVARAARWRGDGAIVPRA
jgi:hypothetical protein